MMSDKKPAHELMLENLEKYAPRTGGPTTFASGMCTGFIMVMNHMKEEIPDNQRKEIADRLRQISGSCTNRQLGDDMRHLADLIEKEAGSAAPEKKPSHGIGTEEEEEPVPEEYRT